MSYGLAMIRDEGRALAGAITAIMTGHAYEQSAEIAATWARFPAIAMPRRAAFDKHCRDRTTWIPCSASSIASQYCERIENSSEFGFLKEEAKRGLEQRARARDHNTAIATPRSPSSRPPAPSRS